MQELDPEQADKFRNIGAERDDERSKIEAAHVDGRIAMDAG